MTASMKTRLRALALCLGVGWLCPAHALFDIGITDIRELEGDGLERTVFVPVSLPGNPLNLAVYLTTGVAFDAGVVGGSACGPGIDYIRVENQRINMRSDFLYVPVRICGNTVAQSDRYVRVRLTANHAEGEGYVLIADDDRLPFVGVSSTGVTQNAVSTVRTTATFRVTLNETNPRGLDVLIPYSTEDGTAVAGGCWVATKTIWTCSGDYVATSGVLRIPAGQLQGSITVPVLGVPGSSLGGKPITEGIETFKLRLGTPTNAQPFAAGKDVAIGTILPGTAAAAAAGSGGSQRLRAAAVPAAPASVLAAAAVATTATPPVGHLTVTPLLRQAAPGQPMPVAVVWRGQGQLSWQALRSLDIRLPGDQADARFIRWDATAQQFQLCQPARPQADTRLDAVCEQAARAGDATVLELAGGSLHLERTLVRPGGLDGVEMRLYLNLSFKPGAADRLPAIEMAATDVFGNEAPFVLASTLQRPRTVVAR